MKKIYLLSMLFLVACNSSLVETTAPLTSVDTAAVSEPTRLTFAGDILPLLTKHECTLCHANMTNETVVKQRSELMIHRMKDGSMPLARQEVPAEDIGVFEQWRADVLTATIEVELSTAALHRLVGTANNLRFVMSYGPHATVGEIDDTFEIQDLKLSFLEDGIPSRFRLTILKGNVEMAETTLYGVALSPGRNVLDPQLQLVEGSSPTRL